VGQERFTGPGVWIGELISMLDESLLDAVQRQVDQLILEEARV
jgi:hypothetical protein